MPKKISFCLVAFLIVLGLNNVGICLDKPDFRQVRWGMSRVEVMASEDMKPLAIENGYISYKFELWSKEVFLLYEFVENSLLSARYVYTAPSIGKIEKIRSTMEKKYGSPSVEPDGSLSWETRSMAISMDSKDSFLRIIYKSLIIEKLKMKHERKINKDEEAFLNSIF